MSGAPVYKIMGADAFERSRREGRFEGSPVDLADGFIHLSSASQVDETYARHFAGVADLVLVAIDPERLGTALRWEVSRGGALFPHLYGNLPFDAVLAHGPVRREGGRLMLPA